MSTDATTPAPAPAPTPSADAWTFRIPKPGGLASGLLGTVGGGGLVGLIAFLAMAKKEVATIEKDFAQPPAASAPAVPGITWKVSQTTSSGTWFETADPPIVRAFVSAADLAKRPVGGKPWVFGCAKCGVNCQCGAGVGTNIGASIGTLTK